MVHAVKTFYCRGALGARLNLDTIDCVWTGEFDLKTIRVDGETFESGEKTLQIQKYPDTRGRAYVYSLGFIRRHMLYFLKPLSNLSTTARDRGKWPLCESRGVI